MDKKGKLLRVAYISRQMVRENRHILFVYGDNMERRGLGGQAASMRNEVNTRGIPTKWRPERDAAAYFTDADWDNPKVREAISFAFKVMRAALAAGRDVVIPADGLGTGLAELPARAPRLHARIERAIARLERGDAD